MLVQSNSSNLSSDNKISCDEGPNADQDLQGRWENGWDWGCDCFCETPQESLLWNFLRPCQLQLTSRLVLEHHLDLLADEGRQVDLAVPLARLARIAPLLLSTEGMAQGAVVLGHEQGCTVADVTAQATVSLQCQRCLQPMSLPLAGSSRVALVESEALAAEVPPEFETALVNDVQVRNDTVVQALAKVLA